MAINRRNGVTGIVLGGGRSLRIGTPKPMIQLGGKLVIARIADTLRPLCEELIFVARPGQDDYTPDTAIALRMHVVTDTEPYEGPLAALHAGLRAAVTPLAFITGADHPFLSRSLISAMIGASLAIGPSPESVVPRAEGMLHPLHSLLVVSDWVPVVEKALAEGETSPRKVMEDALESGRPNIMVMTEDEMEAYDPRLLSLLDIDTPEQLGTARKLVDPRHGAVRPDLRRGGV
jgi:molybdopterin-guanine dinucleotide biosynthesis protein A